MRTNWITERNTALINLDIAWARANVPKWAGPTDDETLLLAMHKTRYLCADLPDDVRHESARVLRESGCSVWGQKLLPEGELP